MSARVRSSRGRPLAMLAVVGMGWVAIRALTWESPFPLQAQALIPVLPRIVTNEAVEAPGRGSASILDEALAALRYAKPMRPAYVVRVPLKLARLDPQEPQFAELRPSNTGHHMLGSPQLSQPPFPVAVASPSVTGTGPNAPDPDQDPDKRRRWSVDAWVLWRQGSGIAQGRRPSYGASQAGAVLNYRLRPSSGHDPRIFVRAYRALIDNPETEVSLGVSARPVPAVPLRVHAEMRATDRFDETEYRPAAFVTTELPPQSLPFGAQAEIYAQAGYVGGDFPTHFADGQVHVMREMQDFDFATVSVGVAAWGGTQKGASRLDVGPSVRVDLDIGDVPARVALDYREQVAGEAEPGSGLAVTVSTRF
ncbi:hypothetical protein [Altererythrobacter sp. GH1-8]|uniref:hypothetical protein n=1 Tax=Altererythrobacter sp. GH1-8 TaxID=3349333 RepID=UPI00374DD374